MLKKPRNFADVFKRYKHYDDSQGRGSVADWKRSFDEKMGAAEAKVVLGTNDPLGILGLTSMPATKDELKRVYRKLILIHHPDAGGNPETAKAIIAAYSLLEDRYH